MEKIRIQKYISDCGVASRRAAEKLIIAGAVRINNRKAMIGDKIDPQGDIVFVDGKLCERTTEYKYIMLNKPRGYVTTLSDEQGRKCVAELVGELKERLYPVGRLDRESEGLLFMTDDGAFANAMMHPSRHVDKTYRVTLRPGLSDENFVALESGVVIDGKKTAPANVRIVTVEDGRAVVLITIHEGRNRQIRKMCESLGLEVARLKRTSIGPIKIGMLKPGQWRELTKEEVKKLMDISR